MRRTLEFLIFAAVCVAATSCGSYKRIAYLQDMEADVEYDMPRQPEAVISAGDRLNIVVSCATPQLAEPFNVTSGVFNGVKVADDVSSSNLSGFEVNDDGNIIYPTLGYIHVAGMTLRQLTDYIENEIMARGYIKEPIVRATFTNFKITVLGEGGTGTYNIPEGKIDIFGALAMSKDLTGDAVRKEVWVIRTTGDKKRLYHIDLTTKDCYYSPAFFLQQNDMIYAKPRKYKRDTVADNGWQIGNTVLTALSVTISLFLVVTNILRLQQ